MTSHHALPSPPSHSSIFFLLFYSCCIIFLSLLCLFLLSSLISSVLLLTPFLIPFLLFLSFFQPLSSYCHLFLAPRVVGRGGAWKHGSVSGLRGRKVQAGVCVCVSVWVSITPHQIALHETNSAVSRKSLGWRCRPCSTKPDRDYTPLKFLILEQSSELLNIIITSYGLKITQLVIIIAQIHHSLCRRAQGDLLDLTCLRQWNKKCSTES